MPSRLAGIEAQLKPKPKPPDRLATAGHPTHPPQAAWGRSGRGGSRPINAGTRRRRRLTPNQAEGAFRRRSTALGSKLVELCFRSGSLPALHSRLQPIGPPLRFGPDGRACVTSGQGTSRSGRVVGVIFSLGSIYGWQVGPQSVGAEHPLQHKHPRGLGGLLPDTTASPSELIKPSTQSFAQQLRRLQYTSHGRDLARWFNKTKGKWLKPNSVEPSQYQIALNTLHTIM